MGRAGIFERMRADHRYVLEKLVILEEAARAGETRKHGGAWPGQAVRRALSMLARQFETHMAAEDEVLFPALIEALPQTRLSIDPLCADHFELRKMLATLEETLGFPASPARNEQVGVQLRDLVDLLRIHIRKEEAVVISVAERVLRPREVEALAARMARGAPGDSPEGPGAGRSKGAT